MERPEEMVYGEIFVKMHTDILDTLSETVLKGTETGNMLYIIADEMANGCVSCADEDARIWDKWHSFISNKEKGIAFIRSVLEEIRKSTGTEILGCRWTDSTLPEACRQDGVILSDRQWNGACGTLYGYT